MSSNPMYSPADIILEGNVLMTLSDFLFSALSFSFEMALPFLKFIRYRFTEKSLSAKAVKKLWSQQVVEMRNILFTSWLLCFSLNCITCAGLCVLFCRFHIEKSSLRSIAKNSHSRAENCSPFEAYLLSDSSLSSFLLFFSGELPAPYYSSSKYNWHHFIWVIGHFAF